MRGGAVSLRLEGALGGLHGETEWVRKRPGPHERQGSRGAAVA